MPGSRTRLNHHRQACWVSQAADPGYMHPSAMCLAFTSFLDIPFSPQMQLWSFFPGYLSFCFQILENDHICMVFFCIPCDCPCDLSSEFCVKTLRISPPVFHRCRAMLPLEPDLSQATRYIWSFSLGKSINFLPRTVPSDRIMVQTASVLSPKSTLQMTCSFAGAFVSSTSSV